MQSVSGSTRALACSDRRPRRSVRTPPQPRNSEPTWRAPVFREGAEHRTPGRVRSPFLPHRYGFARGRKEEGEPDWKKAERATGRSCAGSWLVMTTAICVN
jgi:hypothetical protein